jgi:ABC-type Fe3+-hydroxamate transport system substrate-binding protein
LTFPAVDQAGFTFTGSRPALRIVSLVPSQTELLFFLGAEKQVVGVTKFCIHPAKAKSTCAVVGGTKNPNLEQIRQLAPDLILGNKEENDQASIERLRQEFPVWLTDIVSLADVYAMIGAVGQLTDTQPPATALIQQLQKAFSTFVKPLPQRLVYLIWRNPYMAAGQQTFINSMLEAGGFLNVVQQPRYPELTLAEIRNLDPEVIFLSSEPYPFAEKHIAELQAAVPTAQIKLVDGELFSWYGSRLLAAPAYFQELYETLMPTDSRSTQKDG